MTPDDSQDTIDYLNARGAKGAALPSSGGGSLRQG